MVRKALALLALMLTLAASPAIAQATRSLAPGAESPPADVAQRAWLTGAWEGEGLGAQAIEVYSRPVAGQIAGHFLLLDDDGGVAFYELLQIAPAGDSLVYRLRHFHPDLRGWEDATGEAVAFPLVAIEADAAYFDGLSFVREGEDAMAVTVRIGQGDTTEEATFRYRRVSSGGAPGPSVISHQSGGAP